METLQIRDGSEEVRVEICGTLAGGLVSELQRTWEEVQSNVFWRRFVVDISAMNGYDAAGHALLNKMHGHGAIIAAGTPRSLDYLEEIHSGTIRRGVAMQLRRPADRAMGPRPRHKAGLGALEAAGRLR